MYFVLCLVFVTWDALRHAMYTPQMCFCIGKRRNFNHIECLVSLVLRCGRIIMRSVTVTVQNDNITLQAAALNAVGYC